MRVTVRARTMDAFGDLVTRLGGNPRQVMERAGLDAGVLNRPDEWISFRSVLVAYEIAAAVTGCGNFGIQLSGHRDLSFLGPIALILKYSRDLEQGLSSCVNYMRAHNTGYAPVLEVGRDTASWQFHMDDRLRAHANQWIEESLLTAMKVPRFFLGEAYLPEAVCCRHARREGTDYEKAFGTVVRFGAPFDGIIISRKDLRSPNPIDDQQVREFLVEYLDSRVLSADGDLPGAVRSLLKKLVPTGKFSVDIVADQLGVHRRTLQRRLGDAGLTYAELLDETRARMARDHLLSRKLPMGNLAYMLGYADQSAFNHAFRRWHGTTPRRWRSQFLD